eukprot:3996319-Pleurochrysis_carterae.AAC.1
MNNGKSISPCGEHDPVGLPVDHAARGVSVLANGIIVCMAIIATWRRPRARRGPHGHFSLRDGDRSEFSLVVLQLSATRFVHNH